MTTAQPQHPVADRSRKAVVDDRDASGPRVRDDMTVEVALSLMAGARVDHLVLCDGDDQSTGLITLARLAVLRYSPAYTDRIRLRDVLAGPQNPAGGTTRYAADLGLLPQEACWSASHSPSGAVVRERAES
ncbi:CBS domain-containing protein [Streptomyces sp. S.PNR 29]|uniref:CBS domain-containing protein n=1 Tax=Streptomyces sp. S.PNR 29 TaxID=2973805 RepID=UPI0025B272DF|nr:CBS domain-containing protein [Streptomyces sp. S.PNR 29]MDN0193968.1 CBS domain-containing protein [Streptomyces sp. S.PNR 29]